jgi:hypothetical protein
MPKQILPKRQLHFTKDSKPYSKPKSIKEISLKDFRKVFMAKKKIIILSGAGILVATKSKSYMLETVESYYLTLNAYSS